jgi:glycine betaine/proline transport system substrate-binding protein
MRATRLKPAVPARLLKAWIGAALTAVLATAALPGHAQQPPMPGAGKTVKPIRASWDTFWFGGIIVDTGLERLGYKVSKPPSLGSAALYQALSQGDADYTVDTVMPSSAAYVEKYKDSVSNVKGPIMMPGSIQGYMIVKATAQKYDIKYISDLRDPAKAKALMDGGDRIPLVGPNVGWGSEKLVADDLKRLQLDKTIKLI